MITKEIVIAKIQKGLKDCSEKFKINGKDIRLVISNGRKIKIVLMSENEIVCKDGQPVSIDICNLFQVSAMENMLAVTPFLKKTFSSFAKQKGIDVGSLNASVYTKDETFYPSVNLRKDSEFVTELTINDFLK